MSTDSVVFVVSGNTYLDEITEPVSRKFKFYFSLVNYTSWTERFLVGSKRPWAICNSVSLITNTYYG